MNIDHPFSIALSHAGARRWEFLVYFQRQDIGFTERLIDLIKGVIAPAGAAPPPSGADHERPLTQALADASMRKELRAAYANTFADQNLINANGLCLYAGPVPPHCSCLREGREGQYSRSGNLPDRRWTSASESKGAILYTGDADFRPHAEQGIIRTVLGAVRWDSIAVLQVPHHGSKHNWATNVAAEIQPVWSVFCADPNHHYGHPHREVLIDFMNFHPVIADRRSAQGWHGWFSAP